MYLLSEQSLPRRRYIVAQLTDLCFMESKVQTTELLHVNNICTLVCKYLCGFNVFVLLSYWNKNVICRTITTGIILIISVITRYLHMKIFKFTLSICVTAATKRGSLNSFKWLVKSNMLDLHILVHRFLDTYLQSFC